MTIQVMIKEPLEVAKNPTNKVFLNMRSMSGDADSYENNRIGFSPDSEEEREDLYKLVRLLQAYSNLAWNAQCDINSGTAWERLYIQEFNESNDAIVDAISDLVGWDNTYDQLAAPDRWHLTYFNDKGVEHRVEYTIDGKVPTGRR